jgi:A/G-specific adenine glycosylase
MKKAPRAIPQKEAVMALLLHRGCVLLQKRPHAGIWGGLLSLPEATGTGKEGMAEMRRWAGHFGTLAEVEQWGSFVHTFTHFRLHITPILLYMSSVVSLPGETEYAWYALDQIKTAPLPAPVKKLLLGVWSDRISPDSDA